MAQGQYHPLYVLVPENLLCFTETKDYADIILATHTFLLSPREKFAASVKFLGLSQLLMLLPHWWTLAASLVMMALQPKVYIPALCLYLYEYLSWCNYNDDWSSTDLRTTWTCLRLIWTPFCHNYMTPVTRASCPKASSGCSYSNLSCNSCGIDMP